MPLVILPHGIQASSKTVATLFMPFGSLPHIIQASSGKSRHVIHVLSTMMFHHYVRS